MSEPFNEGGIIPPGDGIQYVPTRKDEYVLTDKQWDVVLQHERDHGNEGDSYE